MAYLMKIYKICILLMLFVMASCGVGGADKNAGLEELYDSLDSEIANSLEYDREKESRIGRLREEYRTNRDENQRTAIVDRLINEFIAYNADSTLYYINVNIERPAVKSMPENIQDS